MTGLSTPTTMVFVGPNDILVLQKNDGQVRRVLNGVVQSTVALDEPAGLERQRSAASLASPSTRKIRRRCSCITRSRRLTAANRRSANRLYRDDWNSATGLLTNQLLPHPRFPAGYAWPESRRGDGAARTAGERSSLRRPTASTRIVCLLGRKGQPENNSTGAASDAHGRYRRLRQKTGLG